MPLDREQQYIVCCVRVKGDTGVLQQFCWHKIQAAWYLERIKCGHQSQFTFTLLLTAAAALPGSEASRKDEQSRLLLWWWQRLAKGHAQAKGLRLRAGRQAKILHLVLLSLIYLMNSNFCTNVFMPTFKIVIFCLDIMVNCNTVPISCNFRVPWSYYVCSKQSVSFASLPTSTIQLKLVFLRLVHCPATVEP